MSEFFDKVKDSINKGVATVSTGSKNVIEKTTINSCIKSLENEKKQLLELLGNKVYNHFKENNDEPFTNDMAESFRNEIDTRLQNIEEQKELIAALDAEMSQIRGTSVNNLSKVCSCGHENGAGSKFCAKCGSKLQ